MLKFVSVCVCKELAVVQATVCQGRASVSRVAQQILRQRARQPDHLGRRYEEAHEIHERRTPAALFLVT